MDILRGMLGIIVLLAICYALSSNRKAINWRLVGVGIGLQLLLGLAILKVPFVYSIFSFIAGFFTKILDFTMAGCIFLFGDVITSLPPNAVIFAFQILPTIIFFAALTSVLYYFGILQLIVYGLAWIMNRTMRLTGAESLAAAANIFIGQTEAPLVVKPYLEKMSKSEILCLMVGGMATVAGGVFVAFISFLGEEYAAHLLAASMMSAPAAIVAAKMLYPEVEKTERDKNLDIYDINEDKVSNVLDAIAKGTTDGLKLAVNVGAMLLVFIAFMALINGLLFDVIGYYTGWNTMIAEWSNGAYEGLKLELIFGILFAPIAWILGTPLDDIMIVGQLLGEKTIINEFVAYDSLGEMKTAGTFLHQKSIIIATYALCGFANFSSIGIQIGGIGAIAPGQRQTLSQFGIKALIGGTIACFLTATIAGMLI